MTATSPIVLEPAAQQVASDATGLAAIAHASLGGRCRLLDELATGAGEVTINSHTFL